VRKKGEEPENSRTKRKVDNLGGKESYQSISLHVSPAEIRGGTKEIRRPLLEGKKKRLKKNLSKTTSSGFAITNSRSRKGGGTPEKEITAQDCGGKVKEASDYLKENQKEPTRYCEKKTGPSSASGKKKEGNQKNQKEHRLFR